LRKNIAAGIVASAFLIGTAGATLVLPSLAAAADPTAAPTASAGTTTTAPGTKADLGHRGGRGGFDAADLTAAAKALDMTEADLTAALTSGKTPAEIAKAQGVDLQKVIDAIVAADKAEIAAAVAAGTMTQAQADERLANLTAHVTDEVNRLAGGPGGHGGPGAEGMGKGSHGGPGADDVTAAAKVLGMTDADVTTALQSGKTLATLATDKGVDLPKVIDAIVAADKTEIAAAVTAGTMTQAQADERIANLAAHVTDEVNGVAGGPGGPGGRGGHGGEGGGRGHGGGPGGHGPDAAPGAPGATPSSGTGG
jgi:hypothetical protein